ncbi:CAP domain-containing protein [Streptomyces yokosukanensis]|uniref:CAP domain-containing protein n=1 Tax=Streptomyces yokosukanensis TaxID=67386 RepID=UPI00341B1DEC
MGRHRRSAAGRATRSRATGGIRAQGSASGGGGDPQDSYTSEIARRDSYTSEIARRDAYTSEIARRDSYAGEIARRDQAPRGIAPYLNPEAYAEATGLRPRSYGDATAKAHAYLFAQEGGGPAGPGGGGHTPPGAPSPGHRRRKKSAKPVRASLIGMSAAVALGTAAVASGVVPGLQNYRLGGDTHAGSDQVQAADAPSNTAAEQGGTSGSANGVPGGDSRAGGVGTSRDSARPQSPSLSASPSTSQTASATPTPSTTATTPTGKAAPHATPSAKPKNTPSHKASEAPKAGAASVSASSAKAEAEVLKLVNQERAKVGCSPLSADSALRKLAQSFSDDMAARGFFDHTDPDGKTPWDRAAAADITDLGGENIARGQADAAAVMQAWMNSPGHKANILNCDFKTLGVGVHFGSGGPWWTQDFGY